MPNINDAAITGIYVSQTKSAGVQDDAPNAPIGGGVTPGTDFDVTLEMVAGSTLAGAGYTVTVGCADLTATASAPGLVPALPQSPPAPATATVSAPAWTPEGSYFTYSNNVTVNIPGGSGNGHVYQYTVSLTTANGQVASVKQSDPFILY
jgi:hypothetical protein